MRQNTVNKDSPIGQYKMVVKNFRIFMGDRITIVSYFSSVTATLFALTIVRNFTPRWSKTIQTNYSYTQAGFMG